MQSMLSAEFAVLFCFHSIQQHLDFRTKCHYKVLLLIVCNRIRFVCIICGYEDDGMNYVVTIQGHFVNREFPSSGTKKIYCVDFLWKRNIYI